MEALEPPDIILVAVAELRQVETVEVSDAADRAVGGVDLAILQPGHPVQRDVGPGPHAVATHPRELTVQVGGVLADEEGVTGAVGAACDGGAGAAAAIAEHTLE